MRERGREGGRDYMGLEAGVCEMKLGIPVLLSSALNLMVVLPINHHHHLKNSKPINSNKS